VPRHVAQTFSFALKVPSTVARSSVDSTTLADKKTGPFEGVGRNSSGRTVCVSFLHQVPGCGPIAVAIEKGADDSAVQYTRERFIFGLRDPLCDDFFSFREAANA
jgi:hypothetical protein